MSPFALYLFSIAISWSRSSGPSKPFFLNDCGLYQMTLFEFAFAGNP